MIDTHRHNNLNEKMETFQTIKDLNRKIKDFQTDNLKEHNYQDLINHLIDFKEFMELNK